MALGSWRHLASALLALSLALLSLSSAAAVEASAVLDAAASPWSDVDAGWSGEERLRRLHAFASVPFKGWNSYDGWDWSVTEKDVVGNIDFIAANLSSSGYSIVVVDYYWYHSTAHHSTAQHGTTQHRTSTRGLPCRSDCPHSRLCSLPSSSFLCLSTVAGVVSVRRYMALDEVTLFVDEYGRVQPDPTRFPSSVGSQGFAKLAAYAHSKGLLFGIHTMRGISMAAISQRLPVYGTNYTADEVYDRNASCFWQPTGRTEQTFFSLNLSHPAGQAFYDSLYQQYAAWGVDFIKNDVITHQPHTSHTSLHHLLPLLSFVPPSLSPHPSCVVVAVCVRSVRAGPDRRGERCDRAQRSSDAVVAEPRLQQQRLGEGGGQ